MLSQLHLPRLQAGTYRWALARLLSTPARLPLLMLLMLRRT
jgi:hypothetical protein